MDDLIKVRCKLWKAPNPEHNKKFSVVCGSPDSCEILVGPFPPMGNCIEGIIYLDWIKYIFIKKEYLEVLW